jgi:hypothetical protein
MRKWPIIAVLFLLTVAIYIVFTPPDSYQDLYTYFTTTEGYQLTRDTWSTDLVDTCDNDVSCTVYHAIDPTQFQTWASEYNDLMTSDAHINYDPEARVYFFARYETVGESILEQFYYIEC